VLEPPHNKELQSTRFLPSSRIRLLLDQAGNELGQIAESVLDDRQQLVRRHIAAKITKTKRTELQSLIDQAHSSAEEFAGKIRQQARTDAAEKLDHEILRLESLQKVNSNVRDQEIETLKDHRDRIMDSLTQTELALDAIRVIIFT
ncbi:MAG: hypothetical protein RLN82_12105, partial [Pseudomonadales bacterium]